MSKHTPGPWRLVGGTEVRAGVRIVAPVGYYDPERASDAYKRETEANARLIAAAPELLAALKRVGCQDGGECPDPHDGNCFVCAAIAKAEGR